MKLDYGICIQNSIHKCLLNKLNHEKSNKNQYTKFPDFLADMSVFIAVIFQNQLCPFHGFLSGASPVYVER